MLTRIKKHIPFNYVFRPRPRNLITTVVSPDGTSMVKRICETDLPVDDTLTIDMFSVSALLANGVQMVDTSNALGTSTLEVAARLTRDSQILDNLKSNE